MNLRELTKLLKTRWITVALATLAGLLGAAVYSLSVTPLYQASTRLFVSTAVGASASDLYQGNRLSQDRVVSYAELLKGETLAGRTVEKLDLDITPDRLQQQIRVASKTNTVLINVRVLDESPVRARDIANALSDEFVRMVRELETPRPGAQPDARVIVEQRATVPKTPVVPRKSFNLLLGLSLGVGAGIGLAVLRDHLDSTVKDQETLEEITGTGVVGATPYDKGRRADSHIHFEKDRSVIAESFRKLRTNLQFLSVDSPPRVILITSSTPNEGKTTTSINIALALAEANHDVVIVDADMRRPSLHKYMNLVGSVGLSNVLSGQAALDDVLQESGFARLTVLSSGPTPPNPSELLNSQAARNLMKELRSRFDYVIVDTSPLLAVTDAAVLAPATDGVLMVTRYGVTKRDQLALAIGNLNSVGANLLGCVFSMIPTRGGSSYSYYYYYYGDDDKGTKRSKGRIPSKFAGLKEPSKRG